jgi:DNA-binding NtrC family response regulator
MGTQPKPSVAVADADELQCRESCARLQYLDYPAIPLYSLPDLLAYLKNRPDDIVIIDVDSLAPDNRFFREIKRQTPGHYVFILSDQAHHPELAEAIGSYIYACLAKPLDPEEFHYWMKSITENQAALEETAR